MAADPTLVELASELVRIDSINPDLEPGAAGEGEVARFVAEWLRAAGLEVTIEDASPGRPNVIGVARGSGGGRSLMLNAHMDTVGVTGMEAPFDPVVRDGCLHGRGAGDMKSSLAAIMQVGAAAVRQGLRGDVIVTAVADEEVASVGTEAVVARWRADAAIVSEPTEEVVVIAHKGFVSFEILTEGVAAHGSRPDLGIDAIAAMGPILSGIRTLDTTLQAGERHPLLGTGSLHASVIEGGQEYPSYPARCRLLGERRTIPGESVADVRRELEELAAGTGATVTTSLDRDPFQVDIEEPLVQLVLAQTGADAPGGASFWAESALLQAAGIPTVVYGPRVGGLHGLDEWVDLSSLERCRDVYLAVATEFCG